MDNTNLFLLIFTLIIGIMGLVVYNIDFSKIDKKLN